MKVFLRFAEKVFTIFTLLLSSGAVLQVVRRSSGFGSTQSDEIFQPIWFIIYLVSFGLLALQFKGFTRIPAHVDKPILMLVGIALISFYWSNAPTLTLRRSVALVGTTLVGIYFAARYSQREQIRLLAWTFGISALLSLLFVILLPTYGIDVGPYVGVWRGVYLQKNLLGRFMTMSSVIFLLLSLSSERRSWITWSGFAISVFLLLMSTSKTALVVFLTLLILLPLYKALQWRTTQFVPLYIISIITFGSIALLIVSEAETILTALGKDLTLTGRTELWSAVIEMIQQRPWLGFGYDGFWLDMYGYSGYIWQLVNWQPPHSHNGFLDVWLDLGILGFSIFTYSFLKSFVRGFAQARYARTWEDFWPILFFTFVFLSNLTQSSILDRNDMNWVLYVAINFSRPLQYNRSARLVTSTSPYSREWSNNA